MGVMEKFRLDGKVAWIRSWQKEPWPERSLTRCSLRMRRMKN